MLPETPSSLVKPLSPSPPMAGTPLKPASPPLHAPSSHAADTTIDACHCCGPHLGSEPSTNPLGLDRLAKSQTSGPPPPPPSSVDCDSVILPSGQLWQFWPNGEFEQDLTQQDADDPSHSNFLNHWACHTGGRPRNQGKANASAWHLGKVRRRHCNGIIKCSTQGCPYMLRPLADPLCKVRAQAQSALCKNCDKKTMYHRPCNVTLELWFYKHGVHVRNTGTHMHPRLTRKIHLTYHETNSINHIIEEHPTVGPAELVTGRRGLHGPRESTAAISSVLDNPSRIVYQQKLYKKSFARPFQVEWVEFQNEHPGFIINETAQLSSVSVVSGQTRFMRSQLANTEDRQGGIVSDASYSYWGDRDSILITSSVYCKKLSEWIPALVSYANGATAEHYRIHFLALFHTLSIGLRETGVQIQDHLMANVVDFSQAERNGFIGAFIQFWQDQEEDIRTVNELETAARSLLKGCQQHFRASVQRVRKITSAVPYPLGQPFEERANFLLHAGTVEDFEAIAEGILNDFPGIEPWLSWWRHPDRVQMLFRSHTHIPDDLWDSLPSTTNAQEAMHHKIYSHCGKKHDFIPGWRALRGFVSKMEHRAAAESTQGGVMTRYKPLHQYKNNQEQYGRAKPGRDPLQKISHSEPDRADYAPPDTAEDLEAKASQSPLPESKTTAPIPKSKQPQESKERLPSFSWIDNSCWVDTTLELSSCGIYLGDYNTDFQPRISAENLGAEDPMQILANAIHIRSTLSDSSPLSEKIQILSEQRNTLRRELMDLGIIESLNGFGTLFGWLESLLGYPRGREPTFLHAYFQAHSLLIRSCTGHSGNTLDLLRSKHWQIPVLPRLSFLYQLDRSLAVKFNGDIKSWFIDRFSKPVAKPLTCCWCQSRSDGTAIDHAGCQGQATLQEIYVHIPVLLVIELVDSTHEAALYPGSPQWSCPPTLRPLSKQAEQDHHLVYRLCGRVFSSGNHFTGRGLTPGGQVYRYDGKDRGSAFVISQSSIKKHLSGTDTNLKISKSTRTCALFYRLEGGTLAQRYYARHQTAILQDQYGVRSDIPSAVLNDAQDSIPRPWSMSTSHGTQIPGSQIFWSHQAGSSLEYYCSAKPLSEPVTPARTKKQKKLQPVTGIFSTSGLPRHDKHTMRVDSPASATGQDLQGDLPLAMPLLQSAPVLEAAPTTPQVEDAVHTNPFAEAYHSPPQSAPFPIACRCGLEGNGHKLNVNEPVVLCDSCHNWSHLACQHDGWISDLGPRASFECDGCSASEIKHLLGARICRPKRAVRAKQDLVSRLKPGKGGLARWGKYWYPWWRGNIFKPTRPVQELEATVAQGDLVDSLWGEAKARRQIRLGRWQHSWDIDLKNDENTLGDFLDRQYQPEESISQALWPYAKDLAQMVSECKYPIEFLHLPAARWVFEHPDDVPPVHGGTFSASMAAQVANWIFSSIPGADVDHQDWFNGWPHSHASAIVYASLHDRSLREDAEFPHHAAPEVQQQWLWFVSWNQLFRARQIELTASLRTKDVDHESLDILEERMQ
ncbi:hypothetical protein CONPUDRAFT_72746 [Coniophora puteana RWD-64-598 SS2]|uniref:Zinc finger PHD-type domain-containing protein n=1 Tax=Coniophora puteana (strain RWD-64-598) TaxID=741705 RepID=A0A5M3MTR1_CONPW|nr:uncharacterized protein CONPUDRAFT_72746 [Coniophora puteana RWD-64-598 SS2]EIW82543.1 hypothetical protein CONPUDRAFT_72746 [Coniophora puteana RWD-64-598 SS2]